MTSTNDIADSMNRKSLRARRSRAGSVRAVARLARIDAGQLSKVERGQASLSVDALYRLAVVLNLRQLIRQLEELGLAQQPEGGEK